MVEADNEGTDRDQGVIDPGHRPPLACARFATATPGPGPVRLARERRIRGARPRGGRGCGARRHDLGGRGGSGSHGGLLAGLISPRGPKGRTRGGQACRRRRRPPARVGELHLVFSAAGAELGAVVDRRATASAVDGRSWILFSTQGSCPEQRSQCIHSPSRWRARGLVGSYLLSSPARSRAPCLRPRRFGHRALALPDRAFFHHDALFRPFRGGSELADPGDGGVAVPTVPRRAYSGGRPASAPVTTGRQCRRRTWRWRNLLRRRRSRHLPLASADPRRARWSIVRSRTRRLDASRT